MIDKNDLKLGDTVVVDVKLKHKDIWVSKIIEDDGDLLLEVNEVYLDSIPNKWIVYVF